MPSLLDLAKDGRDFTVKPDGVNSLVHAGVGSGVVPNDNQVVMTGKTSRSESGKD